MISHAFIPYKKINMFNHRVRQKSEQQTAKGNDADRTSDATMKKKMVKVCGTVNRHFSSVTSHEERALQRGKFTGKKRFVMICCRLKMRVASRTWNFFAVTFRKHYIPEPISFTDI